MKITRRSAMIGAIAMGAASYPLVGCSGPAAQALGDGEGDASNKTKLHVMGVIHSNHVDSESYSLEILRSAIVEAAPQSILTEIPPDRIEQAIRSFRETGEVDEPRTEVFPEYVDVVFPLMREMDFQLFGTAGWTREIADNRRAALARIRNDPNRSEQWREYQAAQREFSRKIAGRGDDPLFVHTDEFDQLVKEARTPYAEFFDDDLGPGGWTQINEAHNNLINGALDEISGQGQRALITFGTAHKYKILESVSQRDDVELLDTRALFE